MSHVPRSVLSQLLRSALICTFLFSGFGSRIWAELSNVDHLGNDPMALHTPKAMGLINNQRCWAITQGKTGFMYVATSHGLDVYDGSKWTLFPLPDNEWPSDLMELGNYQMVVLTRTGIYAFDEIKETFSSEVDLKYIESFYHLKSGSFFLTKFGNGTVILFQQDFIAQLSWEKDSMIVKSTDRNQLILGYLKGDPVFKPNQGSRTNLNTLHSRNHGISYVETTDQSDQYLAINRNGRFGHIRLIEDSQELLFENQGKINISGHKLTQSLKIGDKHYMALDQTDGPVELSLKDGIIRTIESATSLLPTNECFGLCSDTQNGIWVATSKGLLRIQPNTPLKNFDAPLLDRDTLVTDVLNMQTQLLFATTTNLLKITWNPERKVSEKTEVMHFPSEIWNVEYFSDYIHTVGYQGIQSLPYETPGQLIQFGLWGKELEYDTDKKLYYVTNTSSLNILKLEDGNWHLINSVPLSTYYYKTDLDSCGNIWMTSGQGTFVMFSSESLNRIAQGEEISPESISGVPAGATNTLCVGESDTVIIAAENQIYRVDTTKLTASPIDLSSFRNLPATAHILKLTHIGEDRFIAAISEKGSYRQVAFDLKHPDQVLELPGIDYLNGFMYSVSESDVYGNEWMFGPNGAVKINRNALLNYQAPNPAEVSIRELQIGQESIHVSPMDRQIQLNNFASDTKSIRIRASLPFYARNYDSETSITYEFTTNNDPASKINNQNGILQSSFLKHEHYQITVVAIDTFGRRSEAKSLQFRILPPWYLSIYSKVFYSVLVLLVFYLISQWRLRIQEDRLWQERHEMETRLQMEAAAKDAQLQALRLQINPHFLFNSLGFISASLRDNPTVKASVDRLANFLKHALDERNSRSIPLSSEIKAIEQYLEIENQKQNQQLIINFEIEPETLSKELPGLIIQPIVENALKYGQPDANGVLQLKISAMIDASFLKICITNSGIWKESTTDRVPIGMRNVEKRLQLQFGNRANIRHFSSFNPDQVTVEMNIPLAT